MEKPTNYSDGRQNTILLIFKEVSKLVSKGERVRVSSIL